jgi:cytoskeletal protein RodZ
MHFGLASITEILSELGGRLRAQRLAQGISQEDLAARAGTTSRTIKKIERDGRCTLETFLRCVMALGLIDEMESLLQLKVQSIAQMVRAEQAPRRRAPRKPQPAGDGKPPGARR